MLRHRNQPSSNDVMPLNGLCFFLPCNTFRLEPFPPNYPPATRNVTLSNVILFHTSLCSTCIHVSMIGSVPRVQINPHSLPCLQRIVIRTRPCTHREEQCRALKLWKRWQISFKAPSPGAAVRYFGCGSRCEEKPCGWVGKGIGCVFLGIKAYVAAHTHTPGAWRVSWKHHYKALIMFSKQCHCSLEQRRLHTLGLNENSC